jgi:hypothetical protein
MKVLTSDVAMRRYSSLKSRVSYCKLTAGEKKEITLLMTDDEGREMRNQLCDLYGMPEQP